MILKQFNVHLELTDDGVVQRVSRKEHRLLPYETIEAVEFTEPRGLRMGRLRFRLVGDDTVVGRLGVDKNKVEVGGGSAADLERLHTFIAALLDRVERAVPKVPHPELDRYCSNPDARATDQRMAAAAGTAAAAAAGDPQHWSADGGHLGGSPALATTPASTPASQSFGGGTSAEQTPAAPTRAGRRDAERAEAQRLYEQERDRLTRVALAAAVEHAVVREQNALEQLLGIARKHGGSKAVRAEEERIGDLRRAGDLIPARLLGVVEGETGFERLDRTQRLGQLFEVKDPALRVYSDRVVQGAMCQEIDEHVHASVQLDGEQQKISSRHLREKRNVDDRRRAVFIVSGAGWSMKVGVHPDRLSGPRALAAQIDSIARERSAAAQRSHTYSVRAEPAQPAVTTAASAPNVLDQLERLQALLTAGALTPTEFAQLKASALAG